VKQSDNAVNPDNPRSKVAGGTSADRAVIRNGGAEEPVSSLGRRWFIQQLIEDESMALKLEDIFGEKLTNLSLQAYGKARSWDLQGE
jgi:hypothetical protein